MLNTAIFTPPLGGYRNSFTLVELLVIIAIIGMPDSCLPFTEQQALYQIYRDYVEQKLTSDHSPTDGCIEVSGVMISVFICPSESRAKVRTVDWYRTTLRFGLWSVCQW